MKVFKLILRRNPENVQAILYFGQIYGKLGLHKKAIEAYANLFRLEPDNIRAHVNSAVSYGKIGDYHKAIVHYNTALGFDNDHFGAILGLAISFAKIGNYIKAIEYYNQAINIQPDNASTHNYIGKALAAIGHKEEAEVHFKKAISIYPSYAEAFYNLAILYDESEKHELALTFYRKAIDFNMHECEKAYCNMGISLSVTENYSRAIQTFKTAIKINPEFVEAHYNLGIAYTLNNDKELALNEYRFLNRIDKERAGRLNDFISKHYPDIHYSEINKS